MKHWMRHNPTPKTQSQLFQHFQEGIAQIQKIKNMQHIQPPLLTLVQSLHSLFKSLIYYLQPLHSMLPLFSSLEQSLDQLSNLNPQTDIYSLKKLRIRIQESEIKNQRYLQEMNNKMKQMQKKWQVEKNSFQSVKIMKMEQRIQGNVLSRCEQKISKQYQKGKIKQFKERNDYIQSRLSSIEDTIDRRCQNRYKGIYKQLQSILQQK